MNTLLPNLNATPISPAAPGFQADPQPSDASQSFSSTLREVADRSTQDNNQVKSGQNAPASQPAQNTQAAQTPQNADAQNAQATQQASDSSSQVDAKKDQDSDKDAGKTKADKDAAAADSADKTSSDLLALVAAGQSAAQTAQQTAQPIAAPVTADMVKAGADAKKDDAGIDADGKNNGAAALAQALPDAWNAKAGKTTGKDVKTTGTATAFKPGSPAADNKAAANDAATGKADGATQLSAAAAATAGAGSAGAAATAKAPDLQALAGAPATNDNAMFNPALQQVVNASAQTPAAADKLTPTVGSPAWDSALGNKMVWMSSNGQQTATLTLNPRDLGPMQVVINVNKTQADATFIAANPEVKQALEAAMPKLREMMDQAGIQLGQASVSTGMPNQQQAFSQPQGSNNGGARGNHHGSGGKGDRGDDNIAAGAITAPGNTGGGLGIVDTFV